MKLRRSKIFAFVLSLAMVPGAFEIMENVAHLVTEGHAAHAVAAGDRHQPTGPEHGCAPTFHLCGCHTSLAFLGSQSPPAVNLRAVDFTNPLTPDPQPTGFWPSVDRPPRV